MENNNYGFKFEPNKVERNFDGGSKLSIKSDNGMLNMPSDKTYTLANNPNNPNKRTSGKKLVRVLNKDITNSRDSLGPEVVSPGNRGFASVIGLAAIIAVAGVIVAFLTLRY